MRKLLGASALLFMSTAALAAKDSGESRVREAIAALVPGATIDALSVAALPGFYEVRLGSQLVYVSADGKYIVQGSVFDVAKKRDLTEDSRAKQRHAGLAKLDDAQSIVFAAPAAVHEVTVFTDFDCGYCRRLHQQVEEYNAAGITLKYLLYPRGGLNSPSHTQAQNVWCADDRQAAFTAAKAGTPAEPKICPNPVAEQFQLGQRIGVTSTPTIIAADGTYLGGYLTPQQMLAKLEQIAASNP